MFEDLDELARGLAENDISRRQALKWAGYSVLGASLSSMGFAESAEALSRRKRRRCRRRGGVPVDKGECHCALKCGGFSQSCNGTSDCDCAKTTENEGFCFLSPQANCNDTCSSSDQCPQGKRCVVNTCCGHPICAPPCPPPL